MPLADLMSSIFRGLFDPTALAREMADNNISPDELMQHIQKTQQLQTMPTANAQTQNTGSNAQEQQSRGFLGDLMQGTPPTAQAGQAGQALTQSLGQVGPDMNNFLGKIINSLGQTPPTAQAGQAGDALAKMMQPSTEPANAGPQAAQALQPMPQLPQQLQGVPNALTQLAPNPANGTPSGNQFPPINVPPNLATSQFPARPGVVPNNAPFLPNGAPAPSPNPNTPLAMQPNTQPMQPDRAGVERPVSATTPNISGDAKGIRDTAIATWYAGGVTNPYALAALTSTGEHESGFNPANLARTWADPSESGKSGTSGGMFSWRNERLKALQSYAQQNGQQGNGDAKTQASFFLQENPDVVKKLQNAKSVDEAQRIMNQNIAFAGYDKDTGEAARRLQTARTLVPDMEKFAGNPQTPPDVNADTTQVPPPTGGAAPSSPSSGLFSALDALTNSNNGSGEQMEMNLPKPPAPVAPQPGRYDVNPQTMQLMLAMLGPMAGGAQIPSLAQLMSGR